MKKPLLTNLLILLFITAIGQSYDTTTFYGKMDYAFDNVDKSQIPTGLLWDFGIELSRLDNFTGASLHDSNWVTLPDFRTLYGSLLSEQISSNISMIGLDSVNTILGEYSAYNQPLTFACLYYNYNYLDDNAVSNNLLSVSNDQIYDVPGRSQSPYLQRSVFAIAPLAQLLPTGSTEFIIRPELFFGNTGKTISSIQIDPDSSGTYQTIYFNTPFSVNYTSPGIYPVTFIITYTDNTVCYSHTKLGVTDTNNSYVYHFSAPSGDSTHIWYGPPFRKEPFIYGTSTYSPVTITADNAYLGVKAEGDYTIDYSVNNTTHTIKKPLIIVSGFDVDATDKYTGATYVSFVDNNMNLDLNSNPYTTIPFNGTSGMDNAYSYDIIYLHWHNGTDYIERNAYLLETLINWVNANKTSSEPNVIIGLSMGGLVARYALRDMELNEISHQTRLFISHDCPYWGANVPPAYQAMVQLIAPWQVMNTTSSFPYITLTWRDLAPEAKDGLTIFNSPAAQEMLLQRYNLNKSYYGDYSLIRDSAAHTAFYNSLNSMGWPQNCRNIVLSDGSCNGSLQCPDNSKLLELTGSFTFTYFGGIWRSLVATLGGIGNINNLFTLGTIPINRFSLITQYPLSIYSPSTTIVADWGAWSVPSSGTSLIFKGDMIVRRKLLGLININSYLTKCHISSTADMLPIDNAPGANFNLESSGVSIDAIQTNLRKNLGDWISLLQLQKFCFVPTVSALVAANPVQNLRSNICSNIPCLLPSSVSDYYASTSNLSHIDFTTDISNWYFQQQDSTYRCSQLCPASMSISGDQLFCSTSNSYSVLNRPASASVNWIASPSGIVTINSPSANTTTLSKSTDGLINLIGTVDNGCGTTAPITSSNIVVGNTVDGYYNVTSNSVVENQVPLTYGGGSVFLPKNESVLFSVQTTYPTLTSPSWGVTGTYSTYYSGSNYFNLYMVAPNVSYTSNNATVHLNGTGPCGTIPNYYNFQVVAQGSYGFMMAASPNPTSGTMNVTITELETLSGSTATDNQQNLPKQNSDNTTQMDLYNFNTGQLIKSWKYEERKTMHYRLNIADVQAGIYLLKMYRDGKTASTKIIVK